MEPQIYIPAQLMLKLSTEGERAPDCFGRWKP